MSEVPRVLTPLTETELLDALLLGHQVVRSDTPSRNMLGMAWAQCALELGRGKAVWCNNIGNITAGPSWAGDYYVLHVPPPDPPTLRFRAHGDAVEGAEDYWRFLSQPRYATALATFDAGDAAATAYALRRERYYLADPSVYAASMAALLGEFWRRDLIGELHHRSNIPTPEELAATGRLWRLHDELAAGGDALDAAMRREETDT